MDSFGLGLGGTFFHPSLKVQNPIPGLSPDIWLGEMYSDAGTTPAVADGTIQQWSSQSPATVHFSQATSGDRPIRKENIFGSRRAALFDGVSKWLSATVTARSSYTLFVVTRFVSASNGRAIIDVSGLASKFTAFGSEWAWYSRDESLGINFQVFGSTSNTTAGVFAFKVASASSMIVRLNNTQIASFDPYDGAVGGTSYALGSEGGGSFANCYISDVVRFASVLGDPDTLAVENYLKSINSIS